MGPLSQCNVISRFSMIHKSQGRFQETEKPCLSSSALVLGLNFAARRESYYREPATLPALRKDSVSLVARPTDNCIFYMSN